MQSYWSVHSFRRRAARKTVNRACTNVHRGGNHPADRNNGFRISTLALTREHAYVQKNSAGRGVRLHGPFAAADDDDLASSDDLPERLRLVEAAFYQRALYAVALPWLTGHGSSIVAGVGRDAENIAQQIAGHIAAH